MKDKNFLSDKTLAYTPNSTKILSAFELDLP